MNLGRTFTAIHEAPLKDPESQLRDAMFANGITRPPLSILPDGNIHRFSPSQNKRENDAWYVLHDGPIPYGAFGDWSRPDSIFHFRADIGRELSVEEERQYNDLRAQMEEQTRQLEAEKHARAAAEAKVICGQSAPASPDHPYLKAKGVKPHGILQNGDNLIIPLSDRKGDIVSVQTINAKGEKRFLTGGQRKETWFRIDGSRRSSHVYLAEGFATGASIVEATGVTCFVALSANNLGSVAALIPSLYRKEMAVHIVADNDKSGTGERYARECESRYPHVKVFLIPSIGMDANDYVQAGNDLRAFLMPPEKAVVDAKEFLDGYMPTTWLVKGIIPKSETLGMLFGRSGSGKSFFSIDLALTLASGTGEWFGHKARKGNVLYLCAEGIGGMRRRMIAWLMTHNLKPDDIADSFRITQMPGDMWLDSPAGRATITEAVGDFSPDLIIVDTLNRFMAGDENKTSEATLFVQGMDMLSHTYGCAVCVVHHTGQGKDSQDRERGSSVFRGAMDWQLFVEQDDDRTIRLSCTKSKDGEPFKPLCFILQTVEIPYYDEDGEIEHSAVLCAYDGRYDDSCEEKDTVSRDDRLALKHALLEVGDIQPDGRVTLERSKWRDLLIRLGSGTNSASNATNPNQSRRLASRLMASGWLTYEDGVYTWTHKGMWDDTIRLEMTLHRASSERAE